MLDYVLRIRDLVHGTILFTKEEERIINHPFFQRLRQIRQNDVAFYVYPSMNTSRFEHTLGVCRVAGMMAESLTKSQKWEDYFRELKKETGLKSKADFVKVCRFYALLHDIGHLPLSHLFEYAMEGWSGTMENYQKTIEDWTGFTGFAKLHEAIGASVTESILKKLRLPKTTVALLVKLMTQKEILPVDPISIIKSVIDADMDADRIDFVQRDGLMAGGEYGHYDTRRLCDSVFIEQDENGWLIAYSEKALTSMEALLLDRYRTYEWVHFHHSVITMKMLVRFLIQKAFESDAINKRDFDHTKTVFSLRDDVWLWNVLRNFNSDNQFVKIAQDAVFLREKKNIVNLWKTRPYYHALQEELGKKVRQRPTVVFDKDTEYQNFMSRADNMDMPTLVFKVKFDPVAEREIYLYSETEKKLSGRTLIEVSRLISTLQEIWTDEPQYFVLLTGRNIRNKAEALQEQWLNLTANWILQGRMW